MLLPLLCLLCGTILLVRSQTVYYNCPDGWVAEVTSKRCYKFVFSPQLPYVLAAKACAESYSTLVSVTTASEQSFINDYLISHDNNNRNQWYTSGKKLPNSQYVWEGDGSNIDTSPSGFWMAGYQFIPKGSRVVYTFDTTQNGYRWTIAQSITVMCYICEIGQEEAYRVLIQRRDFTFGTPFLNPDNAPYGPVFDPDGVPANVYFLSSTKTLYLECLAEGNPQPSYRWLRGTTQDNTIEEVKTTTDNRYTLTNGRLTIQNPDSTDTKYYRCEASNTQGKIVSNYAQLSLGVLGAFSNVADAPVNAFAYDGAIIVCSRISYEPAVVYNWERIAGGKPEDIFVGNTPYIFISSNGRLYFSEVTRVDETSYYCRATLSGISNTVTGTAQPPSAVSRPIGLRVRDQAAKSDWGPIIQDDFPNVYPNPPIRGQDIRMECFAYGSANNYVNSWNYVWSRPGGLPKKVKFQDLNRIMILENAQAEDEGVYTCFVTRGANSQSRSFTLTLSTKPYFLMDLKPQHIDIGSQLTWQCIAEGNPVPLYSWFRNGTLIPANDPYVTVRNNIITITDANPAKHNGMYQCSATNTHGEVLTSAQLRVLAFAPSFKKNRLPQSLAGAIRGNLTIQCRPEAAPKPTIKWSRRDRFGNLQDLAVSVITGPIVDSTARYQMNLIGDLIITNIQADDDGTYICIASNAYGEDQSSCLLKVQTGLSLYKKPNTDYRRIQNETVFIECEASYDPNLDLVYVWKFNGKRIDLEKEVYFFKQSFNPVGLYITPVQYYHAGYYECTAVTPLNSESATGRLIVEGVPEAPSGIYVDIGRITTNSMILYWTSGSDRGSALLEYEIMYNVNSEPDIWNLATAPGERVFHMDTAIQDTSVDQSKRTYTLKTLLPWNNYTFKIRAKNIKGWGVYSEKSQAYTTQVAAPDINFNRISLNITGGGGSVGDLTIKWNPLPPKYHGAPGLMYRIYWRRNTQVWSAINHPSSADDMKKAQLYHVVNVGRLNYYFAYNVMIQPINSVGNGRNSSEVVIYSAMEMPTPAPKIASCSVVNATAMQVFWTSIPDNRESVGGYIAGYQVNYWPRRNPEDVLPDDKRFIRFYTHNGEVPQSGVIIGLREDSYTNFDVQVFNTAGLGPKSDQYPCETQSFPTLLYPTEVRVSPISSSSVKLTWRGITITTAEAVVMGYKIYLWPANENFRTAFEYIGNFMPTEYTLTSLERGVVYAVRVAGWGQGGDGRKSQTTYFAIAGGATVIDQTVTQFSYLAASSMTSSIVLVLFTSIMVFMLS